MQEKLLRLLLAVSEGRADEAATVAIALGRDAATASTRPGFRRDVADLVAQNQDAQRRADPGRPHRADAGRACPASAASASPPELTMLGKTLLNLDQVGRTLDPDFDPNAAIRRHAAELTQHARCARAISPGNALRGRSSR